MIYGAMEWAEEAAPQQPSWLTAVDSGDADPPPRPRRRPAVRARRGREGTTSLRAVIAASAFLVMFASTTLIGGHAAIDPLLRSMAQAREPKNTTGDIVYPMPDGQFCRHLSFDNTTAELAESTVGPCPNSVIRNALRDRFHSARSFSWGADN
jgi:hypothetical protein